MTHKSLKIFKHRNVLRPYFLRQKSCLYFLVSKFILIGLPFLYQITDQVIASKPFLQKCVFNRLTYPGCLYYICTVKPDLTTTFEQRLPVNNGQFYSSTTSLNLSFIKHLFQTATFFRSQGWPLNTGLTVLFYCYPPTSPGAPPFRSSKSVWGGIYEHVVAALT